MDIFKKSNSRTEFTRTCIAEAAISLLESKAPEQIRISHVVIKAGVSRMTFYNNYHSVEEVLKDYLHILIGRYAEESRLHPEVGTLAQYNHILFSLKFFDGYRKYFMVMKKHGLQNIIFDAMKEFMYEAASGSDLIYEMYFYAGGLLNLFLEWETEEQRKSAEDVATIVSNFLTNHNSAI